MKNKSRGQNFAESMTPENYQELIKWAESEIREYKKFIKIIKSKMPVERVQD
jgi:hypothetical protein